MIRRFVLWRAGQDNFWPLAICGWSQKLLPRPTDVLQIRQTSVILEAEEWCLSTAGHVVLWHVGGSLLESISDSIRRIHVQADALQLMVLPESLPFKSRVSNDVALLYRELGISAVIQSASELERLCPLVRRYWQTIVPTKTDDLLSIWSNLPWRD